MKRITLFLFILAVAISPVSAKKKAAVKQTDRQY